MASSKHWFETVAEAQRRARKRLPKSVYLALVAGSERGVTMDDNVDAFAELGFRPRVANLPQTRDQATSVMGVDVSMPVLISPTGVQAVHPEGEVAVARAAAEAGTAMGLSSFASRSIEDVVAANPNTFFQMYWVGTKERILQRAERARAAGAKGLIVTLDWTFATRRDWGSPAIPERLDWRAILRFAPEGALRPRYALEWLRSGGLPDLTTPNLAAPGEDAPTFFGAYGEWMFTPLPTWEDVAWLREQWGGPFCVKGIMHPDDARRAVDAGATAISVSNHGGNNLDGTPASIRALPAVVDAVGGQVEILLDGGIRRGGDVVKALALGARAVMIGRAYLWGMAAGGQAGVTNVLQIMRSGIDEALLGLGRASIRDLVRHDVIVPDGFTRDGTAAPRPAAGTPGDAVQAAAPAAAPVAGDPEAAGKGAVAAGGAAHAAGAPAGSGAAMARVPLPGSDRAPLAGAAEAPPVSAAEPVSATVVLRRREALPEQPGLLSPDELAQRHGAAPADVELVRSTLTGLGVSVDAVDPASRRVRISGPSDAVADVFGTSLAQVGGHRARSGGLSVPAPLDGVVTAVLGLDDRPQAGTRYHVVPAAAEATGYTPPELGQVYRFPEGTDGRGQTIAIIELGGGFDQAELDAYFGGLGVASPLVTAVGVDGASNVPGEDPRGADGEVLLDIEVAGALAPGADFVVYFAPNTDAGFLDALAQAAHATPTPTAISISWGGSEDDWTAQARTAFDDALADAAALGVTVTAAAGDDGSTDRATDGRPHCDFPASSPHALACGGTRLDADPATGTVTAEVVWNNGAGKGATGGGVSDAFPRPPWQAAAGVPGSGRGVPDVAAVADPQTGYQVRVDGKDAVIGGTSAVAPLWAALVARLVQATGRPLGLVQPALYGTGGAGFRDITEGDNGAFTAGPGWDACTGLGVPDGEALLTALRAALP